MKVGLFFNARRSQGGLYQYALTLVHCLASYRREHDYLLFTATADQVPFDFPSEHWGQIKLPSGPVARTRGIEAALLMAARLGAEPRFLRLPRFHAIDNLAPDLVLYVKPSVHAFLWPYPAVFPVHDLQHLLQPEFREVSAMGESARREYLYRNAIPHAAAVLADSDTGRDDIVGNYRVRADRVHVLPHLAPTYIPMRISRADLEVVRRRYALPDEFFFYPAAFWPHKNHARLIRAHKLLLDRHGLGVPLVLAGSPSREYGRLVSLVRRLGVQKTVRFLGYVPDEDMAPLYAMATALVMPTFFGPSNIPYLEAWRAGCPVITSDVHGLPEQVGDAALLVDPKDEDSLAEGMWRLYSGSDLRRTLVERGRSRVSMWTPEAFAQRLEAILSSALQ